MHDPVVDEVLKISGPLPTTFSSLKSIHLFSRSGIRASEHRSDWARWDVPILEEVAISGGTTSHYPMERFLDGLLSPRIKCLTLEDHGINEKGLAERLRACPNLVELNLEDLTVSRSSYWDRPPPSPMQSLKTLHVSHWDVADLVRELTANFTFPSLKRVTFRGETYPLDKAQPIRLLVSDTQGIHFS